MGNSLDKQGSNEEQNPLLKDYVIISSYFDNYFGNCCIVREKMSNKEYILKELVTSDKAEYNVNLNKYQRQNQFNHPNSLNIISNEC